MSTNRTAKVGDRIERFEVIPPNVIEIEESSAPQVYSIPEQPKGPVVLALPEVPAGTVALIVKSDEGDDVRFTRKGHGWVRGPNDVRGIWDLGTILSAYGPARVERREPRTFPKLEGPPADLRAVVGASGEKYLAWETLDGRPNGLFAPESKIGVAQMLSLHTHSLSHWREVDGPLDEVFDDPGGEDRG